MTGFVPCARPTGNRRWSPHAPSQAKPSPPFLTTPPHHHTNTPCSQVMRSLMHFFHFPPRLSSSFPKGKTGIFTTSVPLLCFWFRLSPPFRRAPKKSIGGTAPNAVRKKTCAFLGCLSFFFLLFAGCFNLEKSISVASLQFLAYFRNSVVSVIWQVPVLSFLFSLLSLSPPQVLGSRQSTETL